jgi:hypothetical protein
VGDGLVTGRRGRVKAEPARGVLGEDPVQDEGVEVDIEIPKRWITVTIPVRPRPIPSRCALRM